MSADVRHGGDDVRGAIDALADRVDTLASVVRETAGSLAASRGEVASLDRRVQQTIGEDTERSAEALASVRSELDALRAFVADAGTYSGPVAVAASEPLKETVATLAERVETLAEVIRSTAGRLVAEQSRIATLTEALAKGDERVEARFAELHRDLRAVSEQAARSSAPPPPAPVDSGLEQRVEQRVGTLAERVDFSRAPSRRLRASWPPGTASSRGPSRRAGRRSLVRTTSFDRCAPSWQCSGSG